MIITMQDSPLEDFNLYSDTELSALAEQSGSEFEAIGYTYLKSDVYQHEQIKFLKIYITQPIGDATAYGLEYFTTYDGKAISLTMSFSNQITASDEATLKSIVDSVVFNAAPQTAETTAPAGASTFISSEDSNMRITYTRYDAWGKMTAEEQAGLNRSDADIDKFTKEQIATIYGISPDDIEMVTYGGTEYYKTTLSKTDTTYGTNITVTITQVFTMDDGYLYLFMFTGTSDSALYADFETVLSSVKYEGQEAVSSGAELPGSTETDYTDFSDNYSAGNILLGLIITIVIYSLPIIIYRYAVRKEPVERKKAKKITIIYGIAAFIVMLALIYATGGNGTPGGAIFLWSYVNYKMLIGGEKKPTVCAEAPQAPVFVGAGACSTDNEDANGGEAGQDAESGAPDDSGSHIIRYCRKCGARLEPDSEFCSQCGEKQ